MSYTASKKGFTLIELLVVIAIITILVAILLPSTNIVRARGRDAKRIADISQIRLALEHYFNLYNKYPIDINSSTANNPSFVGAGLMASVPVDPNGAAYKYVSYCPSSSATGYHLGVQFERPQDELNGDSDATTGPTLCAGQSQTDFNGSDNPALTNQIYDFKQ